ncbi:MAG: hypothetical protein MJ153_00525 [Clostridia bacterium]|nr:hypothetical protein [Clostridia bacterium]
MSKKWFNSDFNKLVRYDLFRMKRTKDFWNLFLIAFILYLVCGYVFLKVDISIVSKNGNSLNSLIELEKKENSTIEDLLRGYTETYEYSTDIASYSDYDKVKLLWGEGIYYNESFAVFFSTCYRLTIHLLMIAIFIPLFVENEYSVGFYKNLLNSIRRRYLPILSKFVVGFIYSLIWHVFMGICTIVVKLFYTGRIKWTMNKQCWIYFLVSFIITYAFVCVCLAVSEIFHRKSISLIFCITFSLGLLSLPISVVDTLINSVYPNSDFRITRYLLNEIAAKYYVGIISEFVNRAVVVSIVCIVISVALSVIINLRRDYR